MERAWDNVYRKIVNFRERLAKGIYRVRDDQRKIDCPHPDYPKAFIVLPKEWLGRHAILKDEAMAKSEHYNSPDMTDLAVCLAILDDWGNIPGLEDRANPQSWDFRKVPVPILSWMTKEVLTDLSLAYTVPKVS